MRSTAYLTRSHPPAAARRPRGFTLIEILVVMVIIGLVAAGAMLSLGTTGRDSQLEQERDRLAGLIDYVRERAALQTVEYGLRCQQGGYQFVMYDSRKALWQVDPLDDVLRARTLPAGIDIALSVEGRPIVLPGPAVALQKAQARDLTPQVMLFSSGDISSFKVTLGRAAAHRRALINSTTGGKVETGAVLESPT